MQNEFGFIKVGRSVGVEQRRRKLEATDHCRIDVVAVVENSGELEESVHADLDDHRLIGEWFEGDDEARAALIKAVGLINVDWPSPLAPDDVADGWLGRLEQRRALASADKEYGRLLREMERYSKTFDEKSRHYDAHIWTAIWRFGQQMKTIIFDETNENGEGALVCYTSIDDEGAALPFYTTNVDAAMTIWPDSKRPLVWEGDAWTCCLAALRARKAETRSAISVS